MQSAINQWVLLRSYVIDIILYDRSIFSVVVDQTTKMYLIVLPCTGKTWQT